MPFLFRFPAGCFRTYVVCLYGRGGLLASGDAPLIGAPRGSRRAWRIMIHYGTPCSKLECSMVDFLNSSSHTFLLRCLMRSVVSGFTDQVHRPALGLLHGKSIRYRFALSQP